MTNRITNARSRLAAGPASRQLAASSTPNTTTANATAVCLLLAGALLALRAPSSLMEVSALKPATVSAAVSATPNAATATATSAAIKSAKHEAVKVNFTDCGAKNIKEVRIWPCPGDGTVCNINLGTNVTVEADFVAKHEASSLTEIIKGVIRGRELQFPEQRADPCKSTISPSCPIKVGKHYQYKASFEVKAHYPAIPVKVRYALANANGDYVACVQISAKIVDPSPVRSSRTKPRKKVSARRR